MNEYLNSSINEMLQRAQALKTKIPIGNLPDCFHQLAVLVNGDIDFIIGRLNSLKTEPKYQISINLPSKLTLFQNIVRKMDYIENRVISALNRWQEDDVKITKFLQKICKEIKYPLLSPVASRLSTDYYCIDTQFNHLRVPLLEIDFLLHIPDLYHELAHPIIETKNHPQVEPFRKQLGLFQHFVISHFDSKIKTEKNIKNDYRVAGLEIYKESWIEGGWAIEFFCDLFGIYTLGSAYAWAHLHLCVKRGDDPFETPNFEPTSHPADNARMEAMLIGLALIGFKSEAEKVEEYWSQYVSVNGGTGKDSDYKWAYPIEVLEHCANLCLNGTRAIECKIASKEANSPVYLLLNKAWRLFIENPGKYLLWEKEQNLDSLIA